MEILASGLEHQHVCLLLLVGQKEESCRKNYSLLSFHQDCVDLRDHEVCDSTEHEMSFGGNRFGGNVPSWRPEHHKGRALLLSQHRSQELVDVLQFLVRVPHPDLQPLEIIVSNDPVLPLIVPPSADLHQQLVGTTRLKKDLST